MYWLGHLHDAVPLPVFRIAYTPTPFDDTCQSAVIPCEVGGHILWQVHVIHGVDVLPVTYRQSWLLCLLLHCPLAGSEGAERHLHSKVHVTSPFGGALKPNCQCTICHRLKKSNFGLVRNCCQSVAAAIRHPVVMTYWESVMYGPGTLASIKTTMTYNFARAMLCGPGKMEAART